MRYNPKSPKNMSIFCLKQQFVGLLSNEFNHCGFNIVLGFESSFKKRICTLRFVEDYRVEVCVNLDYVKTSVNIVGCSLIFKVRYCALFVAEYIKQIERAKKNIPQSYFEGLVFLNAIDIYKAENTISIYSPLLHWDKKPKRTYCIRPIEISSAINALNKLSLFAQSVLNEQDKVAVKTFRNNLLLYSSLPEISYIHAHVPTYTIIDLLKRLTMLITKKPKVVQEFPILTLAPFEHIDQMTVNCLYLFCVQSNNKFLIGVALRLIIFLHLPYDTELDNNSQKKIMDAMKLYIDYSITYCSELSNSGRCFINDNLLAVKLAVKIINDYLTMHGVGVSAGNIHPII